jgi:hypothetical protein
VPGYVDRLLVLDAEVEEAARGQARESEPRHPPQKKGTHARTPLPSDHDRLAELRAAAVAVDPDATPVEVKRRHLELERELALATPTPHSDLATLRGAGMTRWRTVGGMADRVRLVGARWQLPPGPLPAIADKATVQTVARATARALGGVLGLHHQIRRLEERQDEINSEKLPLERRLSQARKQSAEMAEKGIDTEQEELFLQSLSWVARDIGAYSLAPAELERQRQGLETALAAVRAGEGFAAAQQRVHAEIEYLEPQLAGLQRRCDAVTAEIKRLHQHPALKAVHDYYAALSWVLKHDGGKPAQRQEAKQAAEALRPILFNSLVTEGLGLDPQLVRLCAEAAFTAHWADGMMYNLDPRLLPGRFIATIQQRLLSLGFAPYIETHAGTVFQHQIRQWHGIKDICFMMIGHPFFPHAEQDVLEVFQGVLNALLPEGERRFVAAGEALERHDEERRAKAFTRQSADIDERRLADYAAELMNDEDVAERFRPDDSFHPYRRLAVGPFENHAERVTAAVAGIQLLRLALGYPNPWGREEVLAPLRTELGGVEERLVAMTAEDPGRAALLGRRRILQIKLSAGSNQPKSPEAIAVILDVAAGSESIALGKRLITLKEWLNGELRLRAGLGSQDFSGTLPFLRGPADLPQTEVVSVVDSPDPDDENTWQAQLLEVAAAGAAEVPTELGEALWQGMLVAAAVERPADHDLWQPHESWEPVADEEAGDGRLPAPHELPHRDGLDAFDSRWRLLGQAYDLARQLVAVLPRFTAIAAWIADEMALQASDLPDDPRGLQQFLLERFPAAEDYLNSRAELLDDLSAAEVVLLAAVAEEATFEEFGRALEWVAATQ